MTSQAGQDKWVCEFFNYKHNGFFIDVGANDGIWLSNTYYLEKELQWTGICIEAGITPYNALKRNRSCICIQKLIADMNCGAEFEEIAYTGRARIDGRYQVDMSRLDTLMSGYDIPKVIDYISIDTDGYDLRVLSGFPFDKHEVILWTLEHNDNKKIKQSMKELMNNKGYVIAVEDVKDEGCIFEDWYINKNYASI